MNIRQNYKIYLPTKEEEGHQPWYYAQLFLHLAQLDI